MRTMTDLEARGGRNLEKWMTLGMMQRVEHISDIAEMLSASMEDLSEQMANLENCVDALNEATEAIQDRMNEVASMLQDRLDSNMGLSDNPELEPEYGYEPLPF